MSHTPRYTKEDIIKIVKEKGIRFIRLQFIDILGKSKNVAITSSQLEKALNNKCMFDGSSIEGFVRIEESDMYLYPDLDTFMIYPWNSGGGKVARLICDIYKTDNTPFEGDPRYVLKKVLTEAEEMGFTLNVGPECEFFLFNLDEDKKPTTNTIDRGSYFDLGPIDRGEEARKHICLTLEEMGFEIEASHHEVARGQHEIDFKYSDALNAADNISTFKLAVKSIADEHNLYATFMPKPIFGICGSGMHLNMSLSKDGENIFFDPNDKNNLSRIAYNFIAGIMLHIKGITCLTNPLVNSYKRLVPGYEAPVHIAWSTKNRSPLIRIPAARGEGTRMELRNPDPAANPYLALAVCLAAGLHGIKENLMPPPSVDENVFDLSEEHREQNGICSIPENLSKAIEAMKHDSLIKETLGTHIFEKYIEAKESEWRNYRTIVTQWELDNYLLTY